MGIQSLCVPSLSAVNSGWLIPSSTNMDLDNALNELGMLSSVTESRRQYLRERQRKVERMRTLSVPEPSTAATPANSPVRNNGPTSPGGAYRIVQINPHFIVNLSTDLVFNPIVPSECRSSVADSLASSKLFDPDEPSTSGFKPQVSKPKVYEKVPTADEIENAARNHRISKARFLRTKRYRKPYDFPWKTNLEHIYNGQNGIDIERSDCQGFVMNKDYVGKKLKSAQLMLPNTPDKLCSSNASTPEKSQDKPTENCVYRSKSLDELDFAKLRVAEAENHNYVLQVREIDNMSQNLSDLHVNE